MQKSKTRDAFLKKAFFIFAFCFFPSCLYGAEYDVVSVERGGHIRGQVKFPGEPPPRAMFAIRGDPACPRGISQEHLLVQLNSRALQNALISLQVGRGKRPPAPSNRLDNMKCRFMPRVQWAPRPGSIILANSDKATHVIHALRDDVTIFKVELAPDAAQVRRPLVWKGLTKINCERHPWERAWLYVSEHPYVSISDVNGEFELNDIPPGAYTLHAWHEGWVEKGKDPSGQPRYQPMSQALRVVIRPRATTHVLVDTLEPAFLYPK